MELHQVRYFLALASTLNFTRAAEQCNVTQPALTKAVQKLEAELGGELIYRERSLTQLTELGRVVLPMLEKTYAAAEAVGLQARIYGRKEIAPFRIGLETSISPVLIIEPLSELAKFIPGLQVELVHDGSDGLAAALLSGAIHAALATERDQLPDRIDRWRLFTERYLVVSGPGHPIGAGASATWASLDGSALIGRPGCMMTERLCGAGAEAGIALPRLHSGRSDEHLQVVAAAGLGVGVLPEHAPTLPSIVARPMAEVELTRTIDLWVTAGRRYTPALDAFVKIARVRDWLEEARTRVRH